MHARLDRPLLTGLLLLAIGGLALLYSASGGDWHLLFRQSGRLVIGIALLFTLAAVPPRYFRLASISFYGLALVLLAAVLVFGTRGNGAERWLNLDLFKFQPAELMKIAMPLMLAWFYHDRAPPPDWRAVTIGIFIIAAPVALIAIEPDLGTAILLAAVGAAVLVLAGLPWRYAVVFLVFVGAALPLGWHFLHDYQRERMLVFLDPERDPLGAGYHIIQSKIAIGSGGLFGQGFLGGSQAQLDFLPERTTDFIFAVFAEQFGFVGVLALLALYGFIVGRGLVLSFRAQTRFGRLAAAGVVVTFLVYVVVNAGMVMGLVPVVGVPLPLVSYGGTSIVTVLAGFGILVSIAAHRRLFES